MNLSLSALLFLSTTSRIACFVVPMPQIFIGKYIAETPTLLLLASSSNDGKEPRAKAVSEISQEMLLEELARIGADKIASLSISERTKRAMLAEAVEDEIFRVTERLERLLFADGTLPEKHRERAAELVAKTKLLQLQYNELVSGTSSSVLNALESAMRDGGEKELD